MSGSARLVVALTLVLASGMAPGPAAWAQPDVVGQWSSGPLLPYFPVHIHTLPDGRAMLWPGDGGVSGNDPRVWNPSTDELSLLAKPGYDVFCSGHAFMPDGELFVAGGHIQNGVGLAKASRYTPSTDTWITVPDMNAGRWYPTVTTLGNGDILVVSGSIDSTLGLNTLAQVFETSTGTWRDLSSARLALDLYPQMLLAPNGKVLLAGPTRETRYLDTSGTGAWSVVGTRGEGQRDGGSAVMYADGNVLVVGGGNLPTNTAEVIDLGAPAPAWRTVTSMQYARQNLNALLLPDGRVLVTGGSSGSDNDPTRAVYAAEMWDPASEAWTTLASAAVPRIYHSATLLLPDGRVLSTGGNGYPQTELFSPPYLFKGPRPTVSAAPTSVQYGQTFFVSTPDAASISSVNWLRLSSTTHAFNMNQRINHLAFSAAANGLNIVAPSSANLAPPGDYMLFILNGQGVPSVARIVRIGGTSTPSPTVTALSPSTAMAGGPAFTLTVDGTNFVSGATVLWDATAKPTTFVSANRLTAAISAADIAAAGPATVSVRNPDLQESNSLTFTINSSGSSCPTGQFLAQYFAGNITLTGPPKRTACETTIDYDYGSGGPAGVGVDVFSVRWTGLFTFAAGSYTFSAQSDDGVRVYLDGQPIIAAWWDQGADTTYTATRTVTAGDHEIKVEYYEHGGGASIRVAWAASTAPGPTLTTLTPSLATAGGAGFTLTADGTNFVSGATVRWNGTPRTTTFVSSTRLTASIPAADIAAAGSATVSIQNPDLRASNSLTFTINPSGSGCPTGQFLAQYFAGNIALTGTPTRTACEGAINYSYGAGGPAGVGADFFSVSWTGRFTFAAGNYTFSARSDDGVRVYLDGALIISAWFDQDASTTHTATGTVTAGDHEVRVEYYERWGGASIQVGWAASTPLAPTLTTLAPSTATAGGADFTLTADGTNFASGATLLWNGAPRTTTFVSSTRVTAAITAADIASAATVNVSVANPAPGGTSNTLPFTVTTGPTPPSLTTLTPSTATAGGATFTLTADGTNFASGATLLWNGAPRTTTFVSSTRVTAAITAADIASAATVNVSVANPAPGSTSNTLPFTVTTAPTPPTLTTLTPSTATAGGAAFALTADGTNFVSGATLLWNGTARTTTFVSSTRVTASITAADIASPATVNVSVANPAPGGTSNTLPFTVAAAPLSFTLTVNKSGNGTVTSSPVGVSCGSDCTETYASGTIVTLTATPGKNQQFVGWSGSCSGTGQCTITMDATKSVSATFRR